MNAFPSHLSTPSRFLHNERKLNAFASPSLNDIDDADFSIPSIERADLVLSRFGSSDRDDQNSLLNDNDDLYLYGYDLTSGDSLLDVVDKLISLPNFENVPLCPSLVMDGKVDAWRAKLLRSLGEGAGFSESRIKKELHDAKLQDPSSGDDGDDDDSDIDDYSSPNKAFLVRDLNEGCVKIVWREPDESDWYELELDPKRDTDGLRHLKYFRFPVKIRNESFHTRADGNLQMDGVTDLPVTRTSAYPLGNCSLDEKNSAIYVDVKVALAMGLTENPERNIFQDATELLEELNELLRPAKFSARDAKSRFRLDIIEEVGAKRLNRILGFGNIAKEKLARIHDAIDAGVGLPPISPGTNGANRLVYAIAAGYTKIPVENDRNVRDEWINKFGHQFRE